MLSAIIAQVDSQTKESYFDELWVRLKDCPERLGVVIVAAVVTFIILKAFKVNGFLTVLGSLGAAYLGWLGYNTWKGRNTPLFTETSATNLGDAFKGIETIWPWVIGIIAAVAIFFAISKMGTLWRLLFSALALVGGLLFGAIVVTAA